MNHTVQSDDDAYAAVLADSLVEVVGDLCTIDLVDFVSFIRFGYFAAIEDLIHSSTELFFKPGTLISAWTACADVAWESLPVVTLGMEFRHPVVSVFFDLLLGGREQGVAVRGILFEEPVDGLAERLVALGRAIADARIPRRASGRSAPTANGRLLPR